MKVSDVSTWLYTRIAAVGLLVLYCIAAAVSLSVIVSCVSCVGHVMEARELEGLEREIQDCIDAQDYESALVKTRKLNPSDSASSETQEYWARKQEDYIGTIVELKRKRDSSDPSYIPAPEPSEDLLGRDYVSVARRFEESGFTNVETVEEYYRPRTRKVPTGRPGRTRTEVEPTPVFFDWTRGSVSEIEFGYLTSFTTEDHCRMDERIVIHYHGDGSEPIRINVVETPEAIPFVKPED